METERVVYDPDVHHEPFFGYVCRRNPTWHLEGTLLVMGQARHVAVGVYCNPREWGDMRPQPFVFPLFAPTVEPLTLSFNPRVKFELHLDGEKERFAEAAEAWAKILMPAASLDGVQRLLDGQIEGFDPRARSAKMCPLFLALARKDWEAAEREIAIYREQRTPLGFPVTAFSADGEDVSHYSVLDYRRVRIGSFVRDVVEPLVRARDLAGIALMLNTTEFAHAETYRLMDMWDRQPFAPDLTTLE